MTWQQVARKDFEDAVRSKMLWGVMGTFVAFMGFLLVLVSLQPTPGGSEEDLAKGALQTIAALSQLFGPLVALIAGYMAVVGERRSGSLRILLSYPHSRRDVVGGKLVGRAAVIAVTVVAGFAVNVLLSVVLFGSPQLGSFAGVLLAVTLLSLGFVGLAVGVSAGTTTRGRAMAVVIGLFLACFVFWDAAAAGLYAVVTGSLPGLEVEGWYLLVKQLNPLGAYRTLAQSAVDGYVGAIFQMGLEQIPRDTPGAQRMVANRVTGSVPFYLTDWFAGVILLAWGVVPPVFGYLRFRRSDL
jgi:ABC-2 type transport system permease protein